MFLIRFATFFTGLGPIIKIGSIAALVIGLWFGVTWYNNKQRNIGAKKAQDKIFALMQVESEEEWKVKLLDIQEKAKDIVSDREVLVREQEVLDEEKQLVSADRRALSREITFAGNEFARRMADVGTEVNSVPDNRLRSDIFIALAELRQSNFEGNPISFEGRPGGEATTTPIGRAP